MSVLDLEKIGAEYDLVFGMAEVSICRECF